MKFDFFSIRDRYFQVEFVVEFFKASLCESRFIIIIGFIVVYLAQFSKLCRALIHDRVSFTAR